MMCKLVLLFFLLQTAAILANENSRSGFLKTRENKQLKGHVVKRFDSKSLLSCSQQCMRNEWCTSTNYEMSSKKDGKGTCELNKHDISLIDENIHFLDKQGVVFLYKQGCLINSCLNGGWCLSDQEKCFCEPPWTGERCEIKMVPSPCPPSWIVFNESCYRFFKEEKNWNNASVSCQANGAQLVKIESAEENSFLKNELEFLAVNDSYMYWIGLTDAETENVWKWSDGSTLAGYTNWGIGQPNNYQNDDCGEIKKGFMNEIDFYDGEWTDVPCSLLREGYICEM